MRLIANVVASGEITCKTGLHIGSEDAAIEIGGVDKMVIKDPITGHPYIPGSSLKGKLRSLLEWEHDLVKDGDVHGCDDEAAALECPVCRAFGTSADDAYAIGPTRVTVRDAYPTDETTSKWQTMDADLQYTETKFENTIDRVTSKAEDPRTIERVPAGSSFEYGLVYSVYDLGTHLSDAAFEERLKITLDIFENVVRGLWMLEDDALGGNGSRGYGQVSIEPDEFVVRRPQDYREEDPGTALETVPEVRNELEALAMVGQDDR